MDLTAVLLGGFLASIVWFLVGSVFYVNPPVARLHKKLQDSRLMRSWGSDRAYIGLMYLVILVNSLLAGLVYSFLKPALPWAWWVNGLAFGLVIIALAHIPDISSKLVTLNIPRKLVGVDLVSGLAGSFIIGLVLAFFI